MVNDPARCRCPLSVQNHCCLSTSKPTGPQQVALSDNRTDIAGVCPRALLYVHGHGCSPLELLSVHGHGSLSKGTAVHIEVVTLDGGADLTVGRTLSASVHGHDCLSTGTAVCPWPRLSTGIVVVEGMAVCPRALLSRC